MMAAPKASAAEKSWKEKSAHLDPYAEDATPESLITTYMQEPTNSGGSRFFFNCGGGRASGRNLTTYFLFAGSQHPATLLPAQQQNCITISWYWCREMRVGFAASVGCACAPSPSADRNMLWKNFDNRDKVRPLPPPLDKPLPTKNVKPPCVIQVFWKDLHERVDYKWIVWYFILRVVFTR